MRGEQVCRGKVIFEMDCSQQTLRLADIGGQRGQGGGRYASLREGSVKRAFLLNQFLTKGHSLGFHFVKELMDGLPLILREFKLVCQFEDMNWSGVSIQFGGKGQPHAAPGS
jgi:hypothetical protein